MCTCVYLLNRVKQLAMRPTWRGALLMTHFFAGAMSVLRPRWKKCFFLCTFFSISGCYFFFLHLGLSLDGRVHTCAGVSSAKTIGTTSLSLVVLRLMLEAVHQQLIFANGPFVSCFFVPCFDVSVLRVALSFLEVFDSGLGLLNFCLSSCFFFVGFDTNVWVFFQTRFVDCFCVFFNWFAFQLSCFWLLRWGFFVLFFSFW